LLGDRWLMSALPRKRPNSSRASFDHLVGERQQVGRNREAERAGGIEVDHQLEFGRLQHWQVDGLRGFEDLTAHYAGLTKPTRNIGPVAHQPPDLWKSAMSYCHMSFDWCSEAIANAVGGKCISYVGGNLCLCLLIQASNCCCDGGC